MGLKVSCQVGGRGQKFQNYSRYVFDGVGGWVGGRGIKWVLHFSSYFVII